MEEESCERFLEITCFYIYTIEHGAGSELEKEGRLPYRFIREQKPKNGRVSCKIFEIKQITSNVRADKCELCELKSIAPTHIKVVTCVCICFRNRYNIKL